MRAFMAFGWLLGVFLTLPALAQDMASPQQEEQRARDFTSALSAAYRNNPTLLAERAQVKAVDTSVAVAQSGWRPTADLTLNGGIGRSSYAGQSSTDDPRSVTLSIVQPIWRGGRTVAATETARSDVMAERARLRDIEQGVLMDAATSYLDVLQNRQIVMLDHENEAALHRQLDSIQHRFHAGELTVTDVRQAESRLAAAQAESDASEANLEAIVAAFSRATGLPPAADMAAPELNLDLPATRDEAISKALAQNPQVQAASFNQQAATSNIDVARGELFPEISLRLDLSRSWNESGDYLGDSRTEEARLLGSIVVPIYRAGVDYAKLSGAKAVATQRRHQVSEAQQKIEAQAISAWANYRSAATALAARGAQVTAARSALEGVEMENKAGTRSIMDVLDAQEEWRNGRVSQVIAARNMLLARLQLAAVTGQMTPEMLGLQVTRYDPRPHYDQVDGNWLP